MSLLLEQLQNKPVPEKNVSVEVFIPKEGQIEIKTTLIDKRKEGYNRKNLREKMRKRGLVASLPTKKPVKFKRGKNLKLKGAETETNILPKKKKIQKIREKTEDLQKNIQGHHNWICRTWSNKISCKNFKKINPGSW